MSDNVPGRIVPSSEADSPLRAAMRALLEDTVTFSISEISSKRILAGSKRTAVENCAFCDTTCAVLRTGPFDHDRDHEVFRALEISFLSW